MDSRRSFIRKASSGVLFSGAVVAPVRGGAKEAGPRAVILDTDIGNDIDDVLCLVYLLANPGCDLIGVTTSYGQTALRARLVSAILRAARRDDVPVRAGSSTRLDGGTEKRGVLYDEPLGRWPHQESFEEGAAADFLYRRLCERPGEITLISVGPLTNVARLFQRYPDSARMLGRLVIMNGAFKAPVPEYNASGDALATGIVYDSTPLTAVGLDVTIKTRMSSREVHEWFLAGPDDGPLRAAADMIAVWRRVSPITFFHDPLAAAAALDPSFCSFKKVKVAPTKNGVTKVDKKSAVKPHEIATGVDKIRFLKHYLDVVSVFKNG